VLYDFAFLKKLILALIPIAAVETVQLVVVLDQRRIHLGRVKQQTFDLQLDVLKVLPLSLEHQL